MGQTLIEKILSKHSGKGVKPGDITEIRIDARVARDFGGANVVKNLVDHHLCVEDASRTFFTFDCNPGGSDQKYATNQQICRIFARERGIRVYDIDAGIGTHIAVDEGLVTPGGTFVSTDSHANILGSIGAFGQGMGDQDIAAAWSSGRVWFKVPLSVKIVLNGRPHPAAGAKDIILHLLRTFGASDLLGMSIELDGPAVDDLSLSERITIASMATEMGAIIALFRPNDAVISHFTSIDKDVEPVYADDNAPYERILDIDLDGLEPLISRPGHPEDVIVVSEVEGTKIDSAFIGSCSNGRFEDMEAAAKILKNRHVAPGVVLKIVPSTRQIWKRCLDEGILDIFIQAGALVGNAGCAGCAAGQIGQNGPGEVTVSTGNRNFAGKQGKGEVYLASPATAAASAVAGVISRADAVPSEPVRFAVTRKTEPCQPEVEAQPSRPQKSLELRGRIWVINKDNIDTDMIFHNRYLAITEIDQMGQYTFDNLKGWEDFAEKARPGDIILTARNFGAGSSRQQAVDCFNSLGVQVIIAISFGAIYERNAINAGLPVLKGDLICHGLEDGEEITVELKTGTVTRHRTSECFAVEPFSEVQESIYQRGGLLTV